MIAKTSSRLRPSRLHVAALSVLTIGFGVLAVGVAARARGEAQAPALSRSVNSAVSHDATSLAITAPDPAAKQRIRLEPAPITPEQRHKGYHECNPPDPMGLGPYMPYARAGMGRLAVPQRGGHTADWGYDVIVHFHGLDAIRKTLVQVARGVAFAGVDLGIGSGKYSDAFVSRDAFPEFRRAIEGALKRQSGHAEAHIRYLAISAWSAGYGAINEILKHGDQNIDAVILLEGLHAGWTPGHRHDGSVKSVSAAFIAPTIEFARRALHGEKQFVFTHSYVDPVTYPSTALTAKLLLTELGVTKQAVSVPAGFLTQDSAVDLAGLHVWSYRGHDELTHCAHISLLARVLNEVIEEAWDTPEMDRTVPATKAPKLGSAG